MSQTVGTIIKKRMETEKTRFLRVKKVVKKERKKKK